MTEQQHEQGGDVGNLKRFAAFLGILLILISQFLIFSQPVDNTIVFPPYTWMAVLGLIVLALSRFFKDYPPGLCFAGACFGC